MSTLFIVGDSFTSVELQHEGEKNTWFYRLGLKLKTQSLINQSMIGSSQDYAWSVMQQWKEIITPDDYLIVTLTHPSRFWYIQDDPTLGKANHINELADHHKVSRETGVAAEMYQKYIQRPELDTVFLENRLGWLAYNSLKRQWRKPLVIFAFDQHCDTSKYDELIFSKGNLTDHVSTVEVPGGHTNNAFNNLLKGYDMRYNHLSLVNHDIMLDKVYNTLTNGDTLDLTNGFVKDLLTESSIKDPEFIKQQLNPTKVRMRELELSQKSIFEKFKVW
jgi:hypothetical protein